MHAHSLISIPYFPAAKITLSECNYLKGDVDAIPQNRCLGLPLVTVKDEEKKGKT